MRRQYLPLILAIVMLPGCALWNPDHEPDPDDALRGLLGPFEQNDREVNSTQREQIRFAVERLATRHPNHIASQVAAGALSLESGQTQRAQGFVDRALSLEPAHVEARALRVRIAVADGSLDLARKLVDDGLRLRPDAAPLHESSAWLHQLAGSAEDALRALDAAEALEAPKWRISFHRGLVEEQRGNLDLAEVHYQNAIDAKDDFAAAQQRLTGLSIR